MNTTEVGILIAVIWLVLLTREKGEKDYRSEIGRLLSERYCQYSLSEKLSTWSFKLGEARTIYICIKRGELIIKHYNGEGEYDYTEVMEYSFEPNGDITVTQTPPPHIDNGSPR